MYDFEFIYHLARSRYGSEDRNDLHDKMLKLNEQRDNFTFEEYFSQMKEICKGDPRMYHFYFDTYTKWYDKYGINVVPRR